MSAIGTQDRTDGEAVTVSISATDVDPDTVSFGASGLLAFGSLVDHSDGTATLTITPVVGDASFRTVSITVSDDGVPVYTDEEIFDIDVAALDTDSDGLSDYDEINVYGTLVNNPDSDGDLINDGDEIFNASDPLDPLSWPNFADGDIAPLGSPDGVINAADYLIAQRIAIGELTPAALQLAHGDLYPAGSPDGVINTSDLILLLKLVQQ